MSIDSEPVFKERVEFLGLKEFYGKLCEKGWKTFGQFAFSANHAPGNADEKPFLDILADTAYEQRAPPLLVYSCF